MGGCGRQARLAAYAMSGLLAASIYGAQGLAQRVPNYDYFDSREHTSPTQAAEARTPGGLISPTWSRPESRRRSVYDLSGPLTGPQAGDPETIARNFLSQALGPPGVRAASVADLPLVARSESPAAGLTHLVFRPRREGVPFFDSELQVHVGRDGRVWRSDQKQPPAAPDAFSVGLGAQQAVDEAVRKLAPEMQLEIQTDVPESGPERRSVLTSQTLLSPIIVSLVWFPSPEATVPAWQIYLHLEPSRAYCIVVDARTGEILYSRNLVVDAKPQGEVFRAPDRLNPEENERTLEVFTGWPASAGDCPASIYPPQFRAAEQQNRCWIAATETQGNNVHACWDRDGNNLCDAYASDPQAHFAFNFSDSYSQSANPAPDRNAVLTNAFYWANVTHDWLYGLGFDEASGNLQTDNFGRGGAGGDALRLDTEDASVPNNADFITTPDGIAPRMQLGLFPGLLRDSALDADVVIHEYVHALTSRLVGGPANVASLFIWQSGAMAEGWSDAYTASFTDDPVIGEYLLRNPAAGMRSVAYDNSPYTFGQFGGLFPKAIPNTGGLVLALPQVHRDGEIWATVLWELRQALGRRDFEQVVTTALKLTPPRPSMLDGRDAILQAAQALEMAGINRCPLWEVFAARGFGFSADLNPIEPGRTHDTALSVFESFDLPESCGGESPTTGEVIFFDDVEAGFNGWTATGLWHRTTRRAVSGTSSWRFGQESTGSYDTGERVFGSLVSRPIDLTGGGEVIVEWDQLFDGEGFDNSVNLGGGNAAPYLNADSGRLMLSTDDGSNWSTLTTLAHNSPRDTFAHYRVNLSRYAGQAVRLAFYFDTFDNESNSHEGWYIDNIRISRQTSDLVKLQVEPRGLTFSAAAAGPAPSPQNVSITYGPGGGLSWTVSVTAGEPWLRVTPNFGAGSAALAVSVNIATLPEGLYAGMVQIASPGASNSPVTLNVNLTVSPSTRPVAAWSFEETGSGPGVTVADGSGGVHDGITRGFGTIALPGAAGAARLFNGVTDYVEVPPSETLTPPSFTVRTWVKLLSYPQNFGVILSAYGGNYRGWFVALDSQGRVVFMAAQTPNSGPWLLSKTKLRLDCWRSITATFDHASGVAKIYIDGELETQAQLPGLEPETNAPLTMGRASWHEGYYLNFAIDETEIHPTVRSEAGVAADYATFSPPLPGGNPQVALEWPFENGAEDVSGNGHHGTLTGTEVVPGVLGPALSFDGLGDTVTAPASYRLTPVSFTLRAWIKIRSHPSSFGMILENYGGNYQGWYVAIGRDGQVIFSLSRLPALTQGAISNALLTLNRWYHVAVTYDGHRQRASIYLDGVLDREAFVAGLTPQLGGLLSLGRASWHPGYYLHFIADEVRLQPGALSAAEIEADFAGFSSALVP